MDKQDMPKLDLKKDASKLNPYDLILMRRLEAEQLQKVRKFHQSRRSNNIAACVLGSTVVGLYAYTILTWKQENFLDDFNEPEKIVEQSSK